MTRASRPNADGPRAPSRPAASHARPTPDVERPAGSLRAPALPGRRSILVLNHEFPPVGGGGSPVAYEMAKAWAARGHAVSVVTMRYADLPGFEVKDGVRIFRIRCVRRHAHICTVPEMLTFVVSARRFLTSHLRSEVYDIVHAHFIVPGGAVALWAKRAFGLPFIVTSHGSDVLGYNERFRLVYPFISHTWTHILKEAKIVASPTRFLAERIQSLSSGVPVFTIPHALDGNRLTPLLKENRILIVARLIELKGVQDALDALAQINLAGWIVDIVGEGPYRRVLERKVLQLGLSDRVVFHGWIENGSDCMRDLYGKARVFVSASHRENMSVAVIDAMAACCRIVASAVGGTPEILDAASLFEPQDIQALKARLSAAMRAGPPERVVRPADDWRWSDVMRRYEDLCFQ
jgi:glycosyltransferase involved in cell wall biosynthesis